MPRVPDLVERFVQVAQTAPTQPAVEAGDGCLSFAELDRASSQLAHHLRARGVEPGGKVGISLTRGARELVAMVATLKAGAAYVPLLPEHPPSRLANMIEDAEPQLILVDAHSPLASPDLRPEVARLALDDLVAVTAEFSQTAPELTDSPGALAYIMFTSGSTGRPKGVEVTRGALANFLGSMAHTPGLAPGDRLLAITPTTFDIAGLELFLPLWVGATTVIADVETARDPRLLRRRLEQDRISLMQATPATWRLLLDAGWEPTGSLRMLCGGEAMSAGLAEALRRGGGELWNMYGPTETTIWSSLARVTSHEPPIPIGTPIDGTQIHLLDPELKPVDPGEEGEIVIGGVGLARGYCGRPDLTAERFIDHPLGRLYRTGDRGRTRPDGSLVWLGRMDHQVKIRGFRIELGEVEAVLRQAEGVSEAVVVPRQTDLGDACLVAYWTGTAGEQVLRDTARGLLAPYMVPSVFHHLPGFPLNSNGKIDRRALPVVATTPLMLAGHRRPQTTLQAHIARIWAQILAVEEPPVDQNFFTLGGTSFLAAQMVVRLEQELGRAVSLAAFYAGPTIEQMAAHIGEVRPVDEPLVAWLRRGSPGLPPLFCLLGIALYQELAQALPEDRSVVGIHVPLRYRPLYERRPTLPELARHYVGEIRRIQAHGPYYLLGLCYGGVVAYEVARALEGAGERVEHVVIIDAVLPTGVRIDHGRRVRTYVDHILARWHDLPNLVAWMGRRGRRIAGAVPGLARVLTSLRPGSGEAIDAPIDGPEVDAELARFAADPSQISACVHVVRATGDVIAPWMTVDADQGWGGRAKRMELLDVPADHLGVLRAPQVAGLARSLRWGPPSSDEA